MPSWKNESESTYERPGDGTHDGWTAGPGDVVEADANPAPGAFTETKAKAAKADTGQE